VDSDPDVDDWLNLISSFLFTYKSVVKNFMKIRSVVFTRSR